MDEKLLVIDGYAILHRAYHALPALTSPDGRPTGAVYGFFKMIFRLLSDFSPRYFLVALDTQGPNFRHQKFVGYQAKRPQSDRKLTDQIKLTKEIIYQAGIPAKEKVGYEADDVIGTIAKKVKSTVPVLIVTGDKDLMQLVDDRVSLFLPQNGLLGGQIADSGYVRSVLGVNPDQVVDLKGLIGDSSDNYPGALGIGPKTGAKLLAEFSSIDSIYNHLDKVQPLAVKEKLIRYRQDVLLSADLAKICCRVPIKVSLDHYQASKISFDKLKIAFQSLGFRSLLADLNKESRQMGLF